MSNLGQRSSGKISSEAWKPTVSPETIDLRQRIQTETKAMKHRFSALQTMIRKKLKAKDIEPKDLASHIIGMYILSKEHEIMIKKASTLEDIFNILTKYWSFLDFSHLENIAHTYCRDKGEAIKKLDQYKRDVLKFCERRVSEVPQGSLRSGSYNEGMNSLVVVLDLEDPSLEHVLNLKEVIANILGQPASKLVLYDIGKGSVVVTYLITTSLGEELFAGKLLAQKQKDKLLEAKVISLEFKKKTVFSIHQQLKKGNPILCVMLMICYDNCNHTSVKLSRTHAQGIK